MQQYAWYQAEALQQLRGSTSSASSENHNAAALPSAVPAPSSSLEFTIGQHMRQFKIAWRARKGGRCDESEAGRRNRAALNERRVQGRAYTGWRGVGGRGTAQAGRQAGRRIGRSGKQAGSAAAHLQNITRTYAQRR